MTIRKKIRTMILMLLAVAAVSIITLYLFNRVQENRYREYSDTQIREAASAINEIHEVHIYWVAYDYGLWNDMVILAQEADTTWARENLGEVLYWFDLSALWVLDLDGGLSYSELSACTPELPDTTFSNSLLTRLHTDRYVSFYTVANDQLILVQGATIHPEGDEYRESEPRGYLFMARCYDDEITGLLGRLTGSDISLHAHLDGCPIPEKELLDQLHIPYKNWNGEIIACLAFNKQIDFASLLRNNAFILFIVMVLISLFSLLILSVLLNRWVSSPLKTVAEVISHEDKYKIAQLKRAGSEFHHIGILMESFLSQKEELQEAKERAEESDRLKSAFLANVSHEIRTPMSGVTGFAELLRNENLSHEQRMSYLDIIISSGEHLINLIDDVLDLSAIESGHVKLEKDEFDLENMLLEIQGFFTQSKYVLEKKLSLVVECQPPDNVARIRADRRRIRQIIMNLVGNAVKFTENGSVILGCQTDGSDEVLLYVRDSGPGIPEEYHETIFQRFAQVHTYYSGDKKEGTGLGLSICKGLVELMGGRIWVESRVNQGATFYFSIPLT